MLFDIYEQLMIAKTLVSFITGPKMHCSATETQSFISGFPLYPGNGNRGGRGVFLVYPPLAENFSKIPPPLEILGQAAILFFK